MADLELMRLKGRAELPVASKEPYRGPDTVCKSIIGLLTAEFGTINERAIGIAEICTSLLN